MTDEGGGGVCVDEGKEPAEGRDGGCAAASLEIVEYIRVIASL